MIVYLLKNYYPNIPYSSTLLFKGTIYKNSDIHYDGDISETVLRKQINKRGIKNHTNNSSIDRRSSSRGGRVNYHDNKLQYTYFTSNSNITNPNKKRYTGISKAIVASSLAPIVTQICDYQYKHQTQY